MKKTAPRPFFIHVMKKPALFLLALAFSHLHAGEIQRATLNADDWQPGDPPKEVFVVDGKIQITAKDGNNAITVLPEAVTDASAQLGSSAAGESSIQARVFSARRARSNPRFGISVHGMSGHRLILNPAKRQLELHKNDEILATVPHSWTSEAWVWLKLEARRGEGDAWHIHGKIWEQGAEEPAEPQIKHEAKGLKGQGKPGIWGTPYSEQPIHFDDIQIAIELPAAS
ncbi:MAG TPA: hypothetical protein PK490_01560 [Prosthecobacter sp.]|nr:hypothetical protein [Prosthecobacter sp.]